MMASSQTWFYLLLTAFFSQWSSVQMIKQGELFYIKFMAHIILNTGWHRIALS